MSGMPYVCAHCGVPLPESVWRFEVEHEDGYRSWACRACTSRFFPEVDLPD